MKKVMVFFNLMILILFSTTAFSADSYWEYRRPLLPPQSTSGSSNYAKLILPMEVQAKAKEELADLRIVDEDSQEVPFVRVTSLQKPAKPLSAVLFNKGRLPNGALLVTVDTGSGKIKHNKCELTVTGENFIATVKVEGSDDNANWAEVTNEAILDKPYKLTTVNYNPVTFRFLRLTIENKEGSLGQVIEAHVFPISAEESTARFSNEHISLNAAPLPSKDNNALIFESQTTDSTPVSAVSMVIPAGYFERKVDIKTSNDAKNWFTIGSGFVFSYPDGRQSSRFNIPKTKGKYWQVWIYHYNDKPLDIEELRLHPPIEEIVFVPSSKNMYLTYGHSNAEFPRYDLINIISASDIDNTSLWSLGPAEKLEPPYKQDEEKPWTERNQMLLNGALVIMVGVLVVILRKTFTAVK